MSIGYRPEIDGLRAIAVAAVILYHAEFLLNGVGLFSGGFIGVDVFFVISGYLITSILLAGLGDGSFSFTKFYERRARRILPALLTVIVCSVPFAWNYMLPEELNEYAGSVISAIFFSSNFWFYLEDSYTAAPSLLKPFLHTWSLAVEEQFYIGYPIVLFLVWRYCRAAMTRLFAAGLVLSLLLAHYGSARFPEATFFLLPTRGWELLAGAVLAKLEADNGRVTTPGLERIMPALGLFLIIASSMFLTDDMRHPSAITLVPVVGTMLVIWFARPGVAITKLFSAKLLVGIGLISYSLYLWHMPVLAFARLNSVAPLTVGEKVQLIALSVALATLTYFLVERPARRPSTVRLSRFVPLVCTALVALVVINTAFVQGFVVQAKSRTMASIYNDAKPRFNHTSGKICHNRPIEQSCVRRYEDADSTIILLGDSHARALSVSLFRLSVDKHANFIQMTQDGCIFIPGTIKRLGGTVRESCGRKTRQAQQFLSQQRPSIIVYSARLPLQLTGERYDNQEGGVEMGPTAKFVADEHNAARGLDIGDLIQRTVVDWLDYGHTVVMVYPVPEVGWDLPRYIKQSLSDIPDDQDRRKREAFEAMSVSTSYDVYKNRTAETRKILDEIGDHPRLLRMYPDRLFCSDDSGRCYTHDDEHLYYYDDHHLSAYGAEMLVGRIEDAITHAD